MGYQAMEDCWLPLENPAAAIPRKLEDDSTFQGLRSKGGNDKTTLTK
jgi:hypothetical protein